MRSSIACTRCRRSKVKCVNEGIGTVCRACENAGRDCQYPPPLTTGVRARESVSNDYGTDGGRPKAKKRSSQPWGEGDSLRPLVDALDPRLLSTSIWQELYDIFQMHYAADLPFLHPSSFLKPLRQPNSHQPPSSQAASAGGASTARPPLSPDFLLAFLALTARFHPRLVAHHSPPTFNRTSNPLIASEYYAAAAAERLSGLWNNEGTIHDIERIQALLMLGSHEWGMCRGARAWLLVGVAIRSAQATGLQYEVDLDDEPLSRSLALHPHIDADAERQEPMSSILKDDADAFIHQEIRRRTFWSCYIMDRYLSSGKYRPQMLHAKELRIQLPVSERSFLFGDKVRTLMLGEDQEGVAGRAEVQNLRRASVMLGNGNGTSSIIHASSRPADLQENDDDKGLLERGEDEGLVSRYVRVLEIYGTIVKWSCAGGRRTEKHPPWDVRSEFHHLRMQCIQFKSSLPRQHTLTRQNTAAHISMKSAAPYMLVHTVYLLCQIILHREYMPFIPIRCSKPEGPLDPPLFPPEQYDVPSGFWQDSAQECFLAAREIVDLMRNCQEWGALVETPIVGFAIYSVAFVGVYCINFRWMDPDGYMCTQISPEQGEANDAATAGESKGFEASRMALEMLGLMRKRLSMADGWFKTINRMHKYFKRIKSDYRKNVAATDPNLSGAAGGPSVRHASLREGVLLQGGGLDEYKTLERVLKDFGDLEDHDIEMAELEQPTNIRPLDAAYDDSRDSHVSTVKSEEAENQANPPANLGRSDGGPWKAINTASASNGHENSVSSSSNGNFRSYDYYNRPFQQPQQGSPQQPTYSQDMPTGPAVATPGLTSPVSQGGSTASQPSPTFEHQHGPHMYNAWPAHLPMQAPAGSYMNGVPYPQQQPTPMQSTAAYPAPTPPSQAQMAQPTQMQAQHQPWNAIEKEAWLNNLDTRLGGDDFAVFADGGDVTEWAHMSASRGFGGGWLRTVWRTGDGS